MKRLNQYTSLMLVPPPPTRFRHQYDECSFENGGGGGKNTRNDLRHEQYQFYKISGQAVHFSGQEQ